jgi:hypothetical protein
MMYMLKVGLYGKDMSWEEIAKCRAIFLFHTRSEDAEFDPHRSWTYRERRGDPYITVPEADMPSGSVPVVGHEYLKSRDYGE